MAAGRDATGAYPRSRSREYDRRKARGEGEEGKTGERKRGFNKDTESVGA